MQGRILAADHHGAYALKLMGDVRVNLCSSIDDYLDQLCRMKRRKALRALSVPVAPFLAAVREHGDRMVSGHRNSRISGSEWALPGQLEPDRAIAEKAGGLGGTVMPGTSILRPVGGGRTRCHGQVSGRDDREPGGEEREDGR